MKVLFLDIDGVVNSAKTFRMDPNGLWPLDQYMAFLVGKIVMYTDCKVVLSSAWRNHPEGITTVEKQIVPIFDKTESFANVRGEEIQKWLNEHPEVVRYAILDDDSDMLPEQHPNFFKTSWQIGLTDEITEKIIKHLNH